MIMVKYHPDTRFLTDYAAGSLPEAQALCVASHLHYCPACRQKVAELTSLGEVIFTSQAPAAVDVADFEALMGRIDVMERGAREAPDAEHRLTTSDSDDLPHPVRKLAAGNLANLSWRSLGKYFRYSRLSSRNEQETALFFIKAGGHVPQHKHRGDEITVVLKGSFSDQDDHYHVGDFIVRTQGEKHRPVASQDEDCLCLATVEAPILMSNWFYRLLMPLINWRIA